MLQKVIFAFDDSKRTIFDLKYPNNAIVEFCIFKSFNGYHCIESTCPHSGGPLHLGDIEDSANHLFVICPWHQFKFDLNSGISPDCQQKSFVLECTLLDDALHVQIPDDSLIENIRVIDVKSLEIADLCPSMNVISIKTPDTLTEWAILILNTGDSKEKVELTLKISELWFNDEITNVGSGNPPDFPCRPKDLKFTRPQQAQKRGGGGTLDSRIAILHALANIEQWAVDLAWDIIARFPDLPREFYGDFVKVAADEARHFSYLETRLKELGSFYGSLSVHGSLWESALETKDDLMSRLAIVHMVHEARGLDVNPKTIQKFQNAGDLESVEKLKIIHQDEITHVACGQKWFTIFCKEKKVDRYKLFHELVRKHYRGLLKPPFNAKDREKAGLDAVFYIPLSSNQDQK